MDIKTSFESGRLTVFLVGELDHHQAKTAMRSVDELLDEHMPRDFVLDLSQLSFMDSSGIALIVRLSRKMRDIGGRVWIENPASQPRRVIDASGINSLVPVAVSR